MTNPTDQADARPAAIIDKEFQSLIHRQTPEELGLLEASIVADGCRDAIVVWSQGGLILDGYTRYSICRGNGLPFNVVELDLPDRAACVAWIARNQLGRRNLTEQQKDYLRGKRLEAEKRGEGRPEKLRQNDTVSEGATRDKLAKEYGVSPRTIERDAEYAAGVDKITEQEGPEAREAILSGKDKRTKAEIAAAAKPDKPAPKTKRPPAPPARPTAASDETPSPARSKIEPQNSDASLQAYCAVDAYGGTAEISQFSDGTVRFSCCWNGSGAGELSRCVFTPHGLDNFTLLELLRQMSFRPCASGLTALGGSRQ